MKETLLLFVIAFACSITCFAQKDFNIWCFGEAAGLDFNGGSPAPFNGVVLSTEEGNSSIADTNGSLLFYTDGVTVWNSHHAVMPNGTMLWGGRSSTQSALILKKPLSDSLYYIFTTDEALGANGFSYSIVYMSKDDGLGDVAIKNIQLFTPSAEKVCATFHSDDSSVWVLGHETGDNNFRAYLLTSTGLNATPVISSAGSVHDATSDGVVGYMKFSPDGKHLALAIRSKNIFELFDFNATTGVVSNPITIAANGSSYGVEFSSDNTKLYTTDSELDQYDITGNGTSSIIATKTKIGNDEWAIQLGPDQKIYCATFSTGYLDVINSPNLSGAACNYAANGVSLGAGVSRLGLPNHIVTKFNTIQPVDSVPCLIQNIKIYPNPVTDKLIISFTSQYWSAEATVTNMLGQRILNEVIDESQGAYSISTSDFSDGVYLLQLKMCSQTVNKKFIVDHN